jgi:hypothetical protein
MNREIREKENAEDMFVRRSNLTPALSPRPTGGEGECCDGCCLLASHGCSNYHFWFVKALKAEFKSDGSFVADEWMKAAKRRVNVSPFFTGMLLGSPLVKAF